VVAQVPTQNIKGKIVDKDSEETLPGAHIVLLESNPPMGTVSDMDGHFILENVPIGRHHLQISLLGYEPFIIPELLIESGKETVLNIGLTEAFQELSEIVIKPKIRKDKAQNDMATLSARTFSVEEASRFAGGFNDPSRLAGSFAGVTMAEGINDNAIVIRGNAPKGILWRIDGVEIPAPNHLSGVYNGGGVETVFSTSMLSTSDFFTGAFPAEYGNALSGVFDLQLRNGNSSQRESAFQIGSQGIDISSEGPLKKGLQSSYLFNYRYSTMGLVSEILTLDVGLPSYQDLSFKMNMPTLKSGTFSIWGIGGLSNVAFKPDEDPSKWETSWDNNQYDTGSDMAAIGINHRVRVGSSSYLFSSISNSASRFDMTSDQLQNDGSSTPLIRHQELNNKVSISSLLNHKFGRRHTNRTGFIYNLHNYDMDVTGNPDPQNQTDIVPINQDAGQAWSAQAYSQSKIRLSPTTDFNLGMHLYYFEVNQELSIEPRLGFSWRFAPKHSISAAVGKHSQLEPLRFYLAAANGSYLNPDLAITKALHYGLAYDWSISDQVRLKVEPYYQKLYDVPVLPGSPISLLNYSYNMYFDQPLSNDGMGTNRGVDITLERFMNQGYYYLVSGSFFDSKYIGGDQIERPTSFNRNMVLNLLGGKEWLIRQSNTLSVNGKLSYMGGNRFTPPDQEKSREQELVVEDITRAFEWQENDKFYVDLSVNYRINRPGVTHAIIFQAKNLLLQSEMFGWAYHFEEQKVIPQEMTLIYPYISYRIEF
jgi:hypothetical protein